MTQSLSHDSANQVGFPAASVLRCLIGDRKWRERASDDAFGASPCWVHPGCLWTFYVVRTAAGAGFQRRPTCLSNAGPSHLQDIHRRSLDGSWHEPILPRHCHVTSSDATGPLTIRSLQRESRTQWQGDKLHIRARSYMRAMHCKMDQARWATCFKSLGSKLRIEWQYVKHCNSLFNLSLCASRPSST